MPDPDRAIERLADLVGDLRGDLARSTQSQDAFYAREWPRAVAMLDALETRLARLERALDAHHLELRAVAERQAAAIDALTRRVAELERAGTTLTERTTALERRNTVGCRTWRAAPIELGSSSPWPSGVLSS
jgi:DNA repair exonuclease SbcCD ATPase subunit